MQDYSDILAGIESGVNSKKMRITEISRSFIVRLIVLTLSFLPLYVDSVDEGSMVLGPAHPLWCQYGHLEKNNPSL